MSAIACCVANIGCHIVGTPMSLCASRLPGILFVVAHKATALWFELKVSRDDRPYYECGQFANLDGVVLY
jgi:hypothetical protein